MKREEPLRIALVAPLWVAIPPATYGGIELMIKLLADELVRRGHEVTLYATGEARTSAKLRPVCADNLMDMMSDGRAAIYEYYANTCVAESLRAEAEFDVIHCHVGNAWIPMGTLVKTPTLFTLHTQLGCDDEWIMSRYPQVPLAAISGFQVKSFSERYNRKIPVVYNGCDFNSYDPSFEPGKYLAFLGRMSRDKNPLDAIRIAKQADMPIVLAGMPQSKKEEAYFEQEIKPLLDGTQVRHIGPVNHEQKNRLLRGAAALLFPVQWDEPFGLVMIEAMACGTPVIGHNLGSVGEVVDNGVTGFHAGSIEAMHDLVPRALALDRATVRTHAMSRFSWTRMVDDYVKLYAELIAGRQQRMD